MLGSYEIQLQVDIEKIKIFNAFWKGIDVTLVTAMEGLDKVV